jgi:hypothetical protein
MDRRSSRRDDTIKQAPALELVDAGRINAVRGDGITGERGAVHREDAVTFAGRRPLRELRLGETA